MNETSTFEEELVGESNYRMAQQQQLQQQTMYANSDLCDFGYGNMQQQQQQQYSQKSAGYVFGGPGPSGLIGGGRGRI